VTAVLCALFLAVSCLTGPGPNLATDAKLAASEQQGASSRPLNYPMPGADR
jgi:hypothetical protein